MKPKDSIEKLDEKEPEKNSLSTSPVQGGPGKTAPVDPVSADQYSEADEKLLLNVHPSSGWMLVRVIDTKAREELGFSKDSKAYLPSVLLEVISLNRHDDSLAREFPPGSKIWASLEEIAPLLQTKLYLLPAGRIMGIWNENFQAEEIEKEIGFHNG